MADWVNGGFRLFRAKPAILCWKSENFEKKYSKRQKTAKIVRHLADPPFTAPRLYKKRGNDPFDQATPEEMAIASKELEKQSDLYKKSMIQLELQNRFERQFKNDGIEKVESTLELKQQNQDLKNQNSELTRLLENLLISKDCAHLSITNELKETIRFSVASDKMQRIEVSTQTDDWESNVEKSGQNIHTRVKTEIQY